MPDGTVKMATHRLDLQALYDEAPKDGWTGQENGTVIGHIHLQVSDIPQADAFFKDVLGLDIMARYPGASFFATGKYHHHVAANVWNSRGQPKREGGMTGLSDYTIRFNDPAKLDDAILEMIDTPKPVIFDCIVAKEENCFPMIPSGKAHNEMILPDFEGDTGQIIDAKGKQLV